MSLRSAIRHATDPQHLTPNPAARHEAHPVSDRGQR